MASEFAEIQEKYTVEAQKRVKPEGLAQFQELADSDHDRLRHLVDDIWADHAALDAQPSPLSPGDCPKFLIAGAGIGGVVSAVRLIQQGFAADQIRLIDTAGGVGGTWYWNRYPGLHCDVEAYIYMPLLEDMGFMPSHKYASGIEIRNYLAQVVKKYKLEDKILFRTQMNKLEWNDDARYWEVDLSTRRGPKGQEQVSLAVKAEFVYLTAGLLAKPQIPKLSGVGIEGFKGDIFHTSIWDYDVTGGSSEEVFPELSKLKNKKVGVIGTGATAIQAVPLLAKYAKELYVFQRTPSAVYSRGQKPTDPNEWATSIAGHPGWYDERRLNFISKMARCLPEDTPNLVNDQWTALPAYAALTGDPEFAAVTPDKAQEVIGSYLVIDAPNTAHVRQRVKDIVKDPVTAEKLTPWYPAWCKRPTFSDMYLQAFNNPNVHLIDTDGKGCDSITPDSVVANGTEYPLDVLVLSTGYRSPSVDGGDPSIRAGVKVYGRGRRDLSEKIATNGVATIFGVASNGFPNLFWLGPAQAGVSANHSQVLDQLAQVSAYMVGEAHNRVGDKSKTQRGVVAEVEASAEEAWSMRILQGAARFATLAVCTPSYITSEAAPGSMGQGQSQEQLMRSARRSPWSAGLPSFIAEFERWRAEGKLSGVTTSAA
ncbi:FAD/NAD(P)-binding domain-containing protein [Xylariaceae sp. FL1651]|nr:FAD/NAD(P)-binding domain-containing protein [Xylariaceae sp. FL1651]